MPSMNTHTTHLTPAARGKSPLIEIIGTLGLVIATPTGWAARSLAAEQGMVPDRHYTRKADAVEHVLRTAVAPTAHARANQAGRDTFCPSTRGTGRTHAFSAKANANLSPERAFTARNGGRRLAIEAY